jgi:hypothetical protein
VETLTSKPRLLVKMAAGQQRLSLAAGKSRFDLKVEPLFKSIKEEPKVGLTETPQWHIVAPAPDVETDEVNVWDLCHEATSGSLGMAAGGPVEFAEPDLEQRWVFGTASQSLLAAAASCDKAQDPDSRLPAGDGFFWFRDPGHSQLQAARDEVGQPANRVRIGHFDTGSHYQTTIPSD